MAASFGTCGANDSASPGPASLKICQLSLVLTPNNFCTSRLLEMPPGTWSNSSAIARRSRRRTSLASAGKAPSDDGRAGAASDFAEIMSGHPPASVTPSVGAAGKPESRLTGLAQPAAPRILLPEALYGGNWKRQPFSPFVPLSPALATGYRAENLQRSQ